VFAALVVSTAAGFSTSASASAPARLRVAGFFLAAGATSWSRSTGAGVGRRDYSFIHRVARINQRCQWSVAGARKRDGSYLTSTDGHVGLNEWMDDTYLKLPAGRQSSRAHVQVDQAKQEQNRQRAVDAPNGSKPLQHGKTSA
jgi:hypothetical protein